MRLIIAMPLVALILVPQVLLAQDSTAYFPMEIGMVWGYTNGLKIGTGEAWPSPDGTPWAFYFEGYSFMPRIFSKVGGKVIEIREDGVRRLWYDFGADVG